MNNLLNLFLAIIVIPNAAFAGVLGGQENIEIVRTVRVDKMMIGVTSDFKMIAFDCKNDSYFEKASVAILENDESTITFKESSHGGVQIGFLRSNLSPSIKLTKRATSAICGLESKEQNIVLKLNKSEFDLANTAL